MNSLLFLFLAFLLAIIAFQKVVLKQSILSPTFPFLFGLFIASLIALICSPKWGFIMRAETFWILVLGVLSFLLGTLPFSKRHKDTRIQNPTLLISPGCSTPHSGRLALFGVFQIITYTSAVVLLMNHFGSRDIGFLLEGVRASINSATTQASFAYPTWLNGFMSICYVSGFYFIFCFVSLLAKKCKDVFLYFLVISNLVLCSIGSLLGGSRGSLIILISALVFGLLSFAANHKHRARVARRTYLITAILVIALLLGFQSLGTSLGQTQNASFNWIDYFSIYCGAQIKNLDEFVTAGNFQISNLFGQQSFRSLIIYFGRFFVPNWSPYPLDLPFRYANGYSLGNVCTVFYPFLYDFGVAGIIVMPFIMGVVSSWAFELLSRRKSKNKAILSFAYSFIWYCLLFSFFSNKFYELIFSPTFVKYLIYFTVLLWGFNVSLSGPRFLKRSFASRGVRCEL